VFEDFCIAVRNNLLLNSRRNIILVVEQFSKNFDYTFDVKYENNLVKKTCGETC
jgi:hypothetical protein